MAAQSPHFFLHLGQLERLSSLLLVQLLHLQLEASSLFPDSLILLLFFLDLAGMLVYIE